MTALPRIPPAFCRNIGILTEEEQHKLGAATVAVAGLGGIGGHVAAMLARTGIGHFRLCDFDRFEPSNLNRQYGARVDTLGESKCQVMRDELLRINPEATVEVLAEAFDEKNGSQLLTGADLAVDAIDFYEIGAHLAFHAKAREHGLYVLMGSPVGFSACLQVYDPRGMSFEEYTGITPEMNPVEKQLRYATGVVPELAHLDYYDVSAASSRTDFLSKTGPALAPAVSMAAAMVASEAVILLLGRRPSLVIPYTQQFDPYTFRYHRTHVEGGMNNYDPAPALARVRDKGTLVAQVLDTLYQKPRAVRAEVGGAQLYYAMEGQGPPLLLLSPLGVDSGFWARQLQDLRRHFTVITFDYPGTGASSEGAGPVTTATLARDAGALLDRLGIGTCSLLGVALGGLVAQQMSALSPERFPRLVMASSYLRADDNMKALTSRWRSLADNYGMDVLFDQCVGSLFSSRYIRDHGADLEKLKTFIRITRQTPEVFSRYSLAGVEHNGTEAAAKVGGSVLVLQGEDDQVAPPALGRGLARAMPQARLEVLPDQSHFFSWENYSTFNARVVRFLSEGN